MSLLLTVMVSGTSQLFFVAIFMSLFYNLSDTPWKPEQFGRRNFNILFVIPTDETDKTDETVETDETDETVETDETDETDDTDETDETDETDHLSKQTELTKLTIEIGKYEFLAKAQFLNITFNIKNRLLAISNLIEIPNPFKLISNKRYVF